MPKKKGARIKPGHPKIVSPQWLKWHERVLTYRRLIKRLRSAENIEGKKWTDKMIAHYTGVIKELKINQPPKYEE